jgi:hypothetical protein
LMMLSSSSPRSSIFLVVSVLLGSVNE